MAFESLAEFFRMGNHGVYVWCCYGAWFLTLLILLLKSRSDHKLIKKKIVEQSS